MASSGCALKGAPHRVLIEQCGDIFIVLSEHYCDTLSKCFCRDRGRSGALKSILYPSIFHRDRGRFGTILPVVFTVTFLDNDQTVR